MVCQVDSPSHLRPRNPPSAATLRKKSRTVWILRLGGVEQGLDPGGRHDCRGRQLRLSRAKLRSCSKRMATTASSADGFQPCAGAILAVLDAAAGLESLVKLLKQIAGAMKAFVRGDRLSARDGRDITLPATTGPLCFGIVMVSEMMPAID
jgi:hypothetical protein